MKLIPNEFPTVFGVPYKLAIIGECPGQEDASLGQLLQGTSGRFLSALLSNAKLLRQACFIGNICPTAIANGNLESLDWESREIQTGLMQLKRDLDKFQPNICLLLGPLALYAAKNTKDIYSFRGSLFKSNLIDSTFFGRKCVASYSTSYVLRDYSVLPLVRFDLFRAAKEALTSELTLPERHIEIDLTAPEIIQRLEEILRNKLEVAFDVEGYPTGAGISCLSIARSPTECFVIPFQRGENNSFWQPEEEIQIWKALAAVLESTDCAKIIQNACYDVFVMFWAHRIIIRGRIDDTMLMHWEKYNELEKNLGLQCSIYTREPFYKGDRKSDDTNTFWTYNGKDSAVTFEIRDTLNKQLEPGSRAHYEFNLRMLKPVMYMMIRGTLISEERKIKHKTEAESEMIPLQMQLNREAGWEVNVKSNKDMPRLLYEQLKLPIQRARAKNGVPGAITTNYDSMLKLYKKTGNEILHTVIQLRQKRTRISDVNKITTGPDGRIRCGTNLVGTVTGRISSSESSLGYGTNLQNQTKDLRDCYIADPGYDLGQCDLSGADGWTVAAHCAALGDRTMLEDYQFGLKPAKLLALMIRKGRQVMTLQRAELKSLSASVSSEDWDYFACKCVQHGTNYSMKERTLVDIIFQQSEGSILLTTAQALNFQNLYNCRYPGLKTWHRWVQNEVTSKGYLVCSGGTKRLFFGRRGDISIVGEALAEEPQFNTTYVTNLACLKLWDDPENRNTDGSLIIEPLNLVHDAMVCQWPQVKRDWAIKKLHIYFNNPIVIHGISVNIPFEGNWGPSWGPKECINPI